MAEVKTKTINIDKELHTRLRIEAAKQQVYLKDLIEAALRVFLAKAS